MNISRLSLNNFNKYHKCVQYIPRVSFKRKASISDDRDITWGKIFLISALAFGITSLIMLGIKHGFLSQLLEWSHKQLNTLKKSLVNNVQNRNILYPNDRILKLDTKKLRALSGNTSKQAKEALNGVVSSDDLQRVLREFDIGK